MLFARVFLVVILIEWFVTPVTGSEKSPVPSAYITAGPFIVGTNLILLNVIGAPFITNVDDASPVIGTYVCEPSFPLTTTLAKLSSFFISVVGMPAILACVPFGIIAVSVALLEVTSILDDTCVTPVNSTLHSHNSPFILT